MLGIESDSGMRQATGDKQHKSLAACRESLASIFQTLIDAVHCACSFLAAKHISPHVSVRCESSDNSLDPYT